VLALASAGVTHLARFRNRWRSTIGLTAVAFVMSCGGTLRSLSEARSLDVVFVDVGQGDAAIIRTPGGAFLVVDVGPPGRGSSPAKRSLVPLLRSMGARRISALVVSHPHADHDGGLEDLVAQFDTPLVVNNGLEPEPGQLASRHGMVLNFPGGVSARVLSPPDDWPRDRPADEVANNHSVVLRVDYGSVCFLFAGDIEAEAETALVDRGEKMACEVVKVPHHGSRSSSTWPFVKATTVENRDENGDAPDEETFAIMSAGARNRFGHPAPEVVKRWRVSGRTVLSTAGGARWFRSDGQRVWVHRWR
jgi:competence protein ComEC